MQTPESITIMFQSPVFDDEGRFVCLQSFLPPPPDPEVEAFFDFAEEESLALSANICKAEREEEEEKAKREEVEAKKKEEEEAKKMEEEEAKKKKEEEEKEAKKRMHPFLSLLESTRKTGPYGKTRKLVPKDAYDALSWNGAGQKKKVPGMRSLTAAAMSALERLPSNLCCYTTVPDCFEEA
ncbi:hypothetical protein CTA1_1529 [Colletotrichum tanaceti]|uniref:Uncharacterized protein n=1 Tax=Colletotrichum tanaceti TaxID=1306861 RepID=A0A4U6XA25_9PEZI|nr:hypothetical protein CTA1_1529 [Colletotrichum tanaceti]